MHQKNYAKNNICVYLVLLLRRARPKKTWGQQSPHRREHTKYLTEANCEVIVLLLNIYHDMLAIETKIYIAQDFIIDSSRGSCYMRSISHQVQKNWRSYYGRTKTLGQRMNRGIFGDLLQPVL